MNSNKTKLSLALLRSALWGNTQLMREDAFLTCSDDWKAIADFFSRQSLDGLLPDAIVALPAHMQPTRAVKMPLIARQIQVERMNHAMNNELLAFTAELNRRAIPYILLKGQGIASVSPNPLHRVCGDIDLYVPESISRRYIGDSWLSGR